MTHFPNPEPGNRAARAKTESWVKVDVRPQEGMPTSARLREVSATGGMLVMAEPLSEGELVEMTIQTEWGRVHAMAEILSVRVRQVSGHLRAHFGFWLLKIPTMSDCCGRSKHSCIESR